MSTNNLLKPTKSNRVYEFILGISLIILIIWTRIFYTYEYDFIPTAEMSSYLQFNFTIFDFNEYCNLGKLEFGLNGFSLCLILLTAVIMPICIYASKTTIEKDQTNFLICLLVLEILLILSFYTTNLFFFYIFFESVLIPMFLMIGVWGSRSRKIKAAYYFFFFTLVGSLFMLFGIVYLIVLVETLNYDKLAMYDFSVQQHLYLFVLFFIPFAVKIPMFPFHIWLPEAHVEAPTIGSVILASLLLKLGSYGFLKITIPLFWMGAAYFSVPVDILALISVFYASLTTIRQIDMKKIIAYSSIAHMNLMVLGLFSSNISGIDGAVYLMIGHGVVSSALFFCVGVLYDRYHTRLIKYYGGLTLVMPKFVFFLFLFSMANMGFPGTSNFIGEFLILIGVLNKNSFILFFAGTSIVLSAVYSIWLFNRISFGPLKAIYIKRFTDVDNRELFVLGLLSVAMLILGIKAKNIFFITDSIEYLINANYKN